MKNKVQEYDNMNSGKGEEYHYNCAETLLRVANDIENLGLDENALNTMAGFGGGFGRELTCGAFMGALAALSTAYANPLPDNRENVKKARELFMQAFEEHFGSLQCADIKEKFRDPVVGCNPVKEETGRLLQEVFETLNK